MAKKHNTDFSLETLLDLDGSKFYFDENGYWVKFEAHRVKPDKHIPHGISYSLTLHDEHNNRIIGYDNAHAPKIKTKTKKYRAKKFTWDHKHNRHKVSYYNFESASQLIEDFWKLAEKIIEFS